MKELILRSSLVALIIVLSLLLFAPNFLEQEMQVIFKKEYRVKEKDDRTAIKVKTDLGVISDFVKDRENGLGLFFPHAKCVFQAGNPYRCVLRARFITSARINELTQAFPNLLDEYKTGLLPHPLERFFGFKTKAGFKNLKIRMGLDLQGGMRAAFRADYESYMERLKEKFEPELVKLEKKLKNPVLKKKDREDAQDRARVIRTMLDLNDVRKLELLEEARKVITKRLDTLNLSEPEVRLQQESWSIGVDMPGVTNSSDVLQHLKKLIRVEYRIVNDQATLKLNREFAEEMGKITEMYRRTKDERVHPQDVKDIIEQVRIKSGLTKEEGRIFLHWRRGKRSTSALLPRDFSVLGPPVLSGDDMTNAQIDVDPNTGYHMILFELGAEGASKFGDLTRQNVGKRLAILWGERVVSDPVIQSPILGGHGQITGQFTKEEAEEISSVIREGALPLPLEVLSVSFIGPSLGQESIVAGVISILIGFLLVVIFMVGYYKLAGLIANAALFLNLLIIAAILSLLEFTLTLPGFAGVILTVGMAVDANVIIFEKIKEELRLGKSPSIAVESGFSSSLWTILDSNVTTIIAAVILWKVGDKFGDSAIKGFSVTLFFGLLSSMFTALFVSRLFFDWALHLFNLKQLSIGYGFKREVQ